MRHASTAPLGLPHEQFWDPLRRRVSCESGSTTPLLLLGYVGVLVGPMAQHVFVAAFGGLAVGCDRHLPNADHLGVALVGFLQRIFSVHLHGDAGGSGIALHRRVGAIQLGGVRLAGWIGHGDLVAADFIGKDGGVVG